jgi:hypothetical protein
MAPSACPIEAPNERPFVIGLSTIIVVWSMALLRSLVPRITQAAHSAKVVRSATTIAISIGK